MPKKDPRIDDTISKAAPFAQPILKHLRKLVHLGCPEVEETIKWGMASFDYKGPFCSMASFKEHCAFSFWKAALMEDANKLSLIQKESMGHLGKIKSLKDLPADKIVLGYIKEAKRLNDEGIKLPPKKTLPKAEILIPDYFSNALQKNKKALKVFEAFSPSHKKEYLEWITGAKTEATRDRRLEKALEYIGEGKGLHWKYAKGERGEGK